MELWGGERMDGSWESEGRPNWPNMEDLWDLWEWTRQTMGFDGLMVGPFPITFPVPPPQSITFPQFSPSQFCPVSFAFFFAFHPIS